MRLRSTQKNWIMENVPTIVKFKKYSPMRKGLVVALEKLGYKVFVKVLDARDFRVAQMRRRMFIVALKADAIVTQFEWPLAAASAPKIRKHLDKFDPSVDKAGRLPRGLGCQNIVKKAYRAAHRAGLDPITQDIIVDHQASAMFSTWQLDVSPTLTRARARNGGFWISSRGRHMTLAEIGRLMGFKDTEMDKWPKGRNTTAIGGMLGNAVPVPRMQGVLESALAAVGLA